MWLFTVEGFLSIGAGRGEAWDEVMLRARTVGDIERFCKHYKVMPAKAIAHTPDLDYPYRAPVKRQDLAAALGQVVGEINYSKFKTAVGERIGKRYYDLLLKCWSVLLSLEPGGMTRYLNQALGRKGRRRPDEVVPASPRGKVIPLMRFGMFSEKGERTASALAREVERVMAKGVREVRKRHPEILDTAVREAFGEAMDESLWRAFHPDENRR